MNQLEVGRKRQQIRGQYGYGYKKTGWVCLQNISDYSPFGAPLDGRTIQSDFYRYSFQGQERDDEVKGVGNSLNFEYRMHDPRVGRFFAVDPLSREYPFYSSYQFSGNELIHMRELEGLEPGVAFKSVEDAAKNFGEMYNGMSIIDGVEYGTNIYKVVKDDYVFYYYEEPNKGDKATVRMPYTFNNTGTRVATIHAHGEYLKKYENNKFSPTDMSNAENRGVDNYVTTPAGYLRKYDVETNKVTVVSKEMPSDPKDPDRLNNIKPERKPKNPLQKHAEQKRKDEQENNKNKPVVPKALIKDNTNVVLPQIQISDL